MIRLPAAVTSLPGRFRRRLRRAMRQGREHGWPAAAGPRRTGRGDGTREFALALPVPPRAEGHRSAPRLQVRADARLYVPRMLEESGLAGYEPETMSCFLAALDVLPRGPVFDIGANVGVFALVAAALSDWTVVAFEPTPELARTARELAELNGLECRVEELALGAEAGRASFYLSNVTDSSNSLRPGFRPSSRTISVDVRTLDEYCRSTSLRPSILKIDTESTEPDVLRGATDLLAGDRPWIICEVLAGRTEAELMSLLAPLGYAWYQITDEQPLRPRQEIVGDTTYRAMNWLFTPDPPGHPFWQARERWLDALRRTPPRENRPTLAVAIDAPEAPLGVRGSGPSGP